MSITRTLRRVTAVALLAALPALAVPAVSSADATTDRTAVVADPGWGVRIADLPADPPVDSALTDPGWG
ncbi:hypothetical protein ACWD6O_13625 [Streptomyces californicus]